MIARYGAASESQRKELSAVYANFSRLPSKCLPTRPISSYDRRRGPGKSYEASWGRFFFGEVNEGGPMKEDDLDDFWSKLGFVLMTIDGMEDQNAAAALGAFLEGYLEGMERGQHPQSRFVHAD